MLASVLQAASLRRRAALRALLAHGADEVSVVSNAPFALQKELAALRAAAGCPRSRA